MESYTFYSAATGIGKNRAMRKVRTGYKTLLNEEFHEYILQQIVKGWTNQRG
jgi:hypothetical protein